MASCDLATLQAQACSNGFLGLSDKQAKALILQGFSDLGGNALTAEQLLTQAKAGGFCGLSEKQADALLLQELCNLSDGVLDCVNVIPAGAVYDSEGNYSPPLNGGQTYLLTWGANEVGFTNTGGSPESTPGAVVPGETVQFVASETTDFALLGLEGESPVTATICAL